MATSSERRTSRKENSVVKTDAQEAMTPDPKLFELEALGSSPQHDAVNAAVRHGDSEEPANTLRAWILGSICVTASAGVNMFLSMRSPAILIPTVAILLIVHPAGCLWARIMPTRRFKTFGVVWALKPGPWNIKEHTVVTLMANVTYGYAYSTDALLALKSKSLYNIDLGWGFAIIFTISSQMIGIGLAGLFRRFLVWPAALVWPTNFSTTTLLYALHDTTRPDPDSTNGWRLSQYRYFLYVTLGMFAYYWIPATLFQGLSVFSFVTWIRPDSTVVNQLFGGLTGLSLIPITFDWTYVTAYLSDPLLSPTVSHVNTLIGLIAFVVIPTIGISYTGAWYSAYLPINTSTTFDNTQSPYDIREILTPDFTFDADKYKAYSPMFLAPTFALNYGLSFAALSASIVHTGIHRGKQLWYQFRTASQQVADVHYELIRKYKEAPDWWYLIVFAAAMALALATVEGFPVQLPWWGLFVACLVALVFIVPCCTILGITNIQLSLNVIGPFIGGYIFHGQPIGVMIFKVYSTIVVGQAQTFSGDLKLAQYMKVPPRITFSAQIAASIWACVVQVAVMNWALANIEGVCSESQPNHFTCPNGRTFFSNSITWGVIGPHRMFSKGSIYVALQYFWVLGALLPIVFWVVCRATKSKLLSDLHAPVMIGAMGWLPPATPLSFASWAIVGLIFNYGIRKRYHGWWSTYNYLTAAGLDTGLIFCTIVVFLAITLPNATVPQWWGNVGVFDTKDYLGTALRKTVVGGQKFGPTSW
ncbi:hypothetical protein M409DRAFT_69069 [Zasmidium cellare ATCC 36951]|uniref:OPT family small oligopeptide transporter n=1 Tax=Zasmidium cellare ATCC 36951 TaxID=1080233 RepID=A0A6A6C5Y2_ZASCE|nr:uncharacterized protein M409DRAFT_69069 [Zasmidium cellare ATCC 36951]KAF2162461.1 hypothetical protein M409DRAFT_69069 [Zasmidium cellare ATCC 36951]